MTHWKHLEFLPENFFLLQKELKHHPDLLRKLDNHPAGEWEIRMAEIAAHCEVVLDATYTPEDIDKLAGLLERKLFNMRPKVRSTNIILPH